MQFADKESISGQGKLDLGILAVKVGQPLLAQKALQRGYDHSQRLSKLDNKKPVITTPQFNQLKQLSSGHSEVISEDLLDAFDKMRKDQYEGKNGMD